ncbi:peptidase M38 [Bosea sp. WAO]|uniref:metal-dependent hydrolase family protein n=1 Tax=unclassified Bosea (in: a-proteobacteria) TaxID=2653178 RepID=UPI0007469014|nr:MULTISPECIES: amidohydrolase family protein [unclassified Bosea (in: a-proteobacteria)]KUL92616.1 peptidase M38 [Bosea sp. WAO]HEV7339731.1 amidohydrolase family protein [Bosea sp. (in: a-proteobacteria)]
MTQAIIFENARLLDGTSPEGEHDRFVRVEGGLIREVSDRPIADGGARRIDLKGRTLMPGLIDCHVHVIANSANFGQNAMLPDALVALQAVKLMGEMLQRGFTTVRDVGGATYALVEAQEQGLYVGPRLVICGKALSQTGGHADFRGRYDNRRPDYQTHQLGSLGRVCDGVDACRAAARDEIRQGAQFVKIMANGGIASPTDPIAFLGFSDAEITAIVEEAHNAQTYVAAHLYTDEGIARAVKLGVRSVEHANLIQAATARLMHERGAIACPTLVTYEALNNEGASYGLPPSSVAKIDDVRLRGLESLEIMRQAGVKMAYGTDLLGAMHRHQSEEFVIRGRVLPAIEVIRSATVNAAELIGMPGKIGVIAPDAYADLIVVDGDPLADLSLLTGQGGHLPIIMKSGDFIKNELN